MTTLWSAIWCYSVLIRTFFELDKENLENKVYVQHSYLTRFVFHIENIVSASNDLCCRMTAIDIRLVVNLPAVVVDDIAYFKEILRAARLWGFFFTFGTFLTLPASELRAEQRFYKMLNSAISYLRDGFDIFLHPCSTGRFHLHGDIPLTVFALP